MRILLAVALCLMTACSKSEKQEEAIGSALEADPARVQPRRPLTVSNAPPKTVRANGWAGPMTAMSGAWTKQLQNCLEVHTALPEAQYEALSQAEKDAWAALHADILMQWDGDKAAEPLGCDQRFAEVPTLAQCTFELPLAMATVHHMRDSSRTLVEQYGDESLVRFHYRYYNPKSALDQPLFRERCESIDGARWTSVDKTSDEYKRSVRLYAEAAPVTQQEAPPMGPETGGLQGSPSE
ncbi:MAG: hypothetical protein WBG86_08950 [Polyangiales bacterium]